jgi:hypothetical protein
MRACQAIIALGCGVLAGCASSRVEPTPPHFTAAGPFAGANGADVVQMTVAVIERPYGDPFLNRGLWALADEQGVSLERKPTLDANGFRVCQVGGWTPGDLQELLTSPRSCPNPRGIQVHAGTAVPIPLGAPWKVCRFRLCHDDQTQWVEWKDAQCLLEVLPTLTDDGQVRLKFTPHVKHGAPAVAFVANQEPSGTLHWARQEHEPEEAYDRLSWDMVVSPNEYVIVGIRLERTGTLGQACFLPEPEQTRVQRLLVLRINRSMVATPETQVGRAPPLALRASLTAVRGKGD